MNDVPTISFCEKCGSKILDGDTICGNCGCETRAAVQQRNTAERKAKTKKRIIIASATVAFLVIALIAGLFIRNHIRREQIKDMLAGNRYEYLYYGYSYDTYCYYAFDEDANCTRYSYSYYSSMDKEHEYEYGVDYEIVFKGGKVFLETSMYTLEVRFDSYGDIESLYDITFEEEYD